MTERAKFVVFSRQGCHLCEQMLEELGPLLRGRADLAVVDVDERVEWRDRYGLRVPVLEVDGRPICEYTLDHQAVLAAIGRASASGTEPRPGGVAIDR